MSSSSSTSPSSFFSSISTIAVAQISRSVGYHGARSTALRSLADLAAEYLLSLAALASDSATSAGRTDANLFDVIIAIEHLTSPRGFLGASDLSRPLLRSSILKDIVRFVHAVDEIPFATAIGRIPGREKRRGCVTFAQAGREPPRHVPRWLPEFPRACGKRPAPEREALWPFSRPNGTKTREEKREGRCCDAFETMRELPVKEERAKVSFPLYSSSSPPGRKVSKDLTTVGGMKRIGGQSVSLAKEIVNDRSGFFRSLRMVHYCELSNRPNMVLDNHSSAHLISPDH